MLLILRRIHLYSGLALSPFVLLYGITALLFNHPDWFQERQQRNLSAAAVASTALIHNSADALGTAHALVPLGQTVTSARWQGTWSFDIAQGPAMARVELDAAGKGGRIIEWIPRPAPSEAWPPSSLAPQGIPGWSPLEAAAAQSASALGLQPGTIQWKRAARLEFQTAQLGPQTWCSYDPRTQQVTLRPADAEADLAGVMKGLHLAHSNPGFVSPRWWWFCVVDLMGCTMILWAVSGLLMWWPMRALRHSGAIVLLLGVLTMAWLAITLS